MCGLAGIARFSGASAPEDVQVLREMARTLVHRGPDDTTFRFDDAVGLAFDRLSIVDPVGGAQPLVSEDESVALIANGEVYNHRELEARLPAGARPRTRSDCEVLVHLYRQHGRRFLDDVRGIFAVAIWDRRRPRLVLARDRFGVKPRYFHRAEQRLVSGPGGRARFPGPRRPPARARG